MKQTLQHTAGLRPTFSGSNASLPFGELLGMLAASSSNGVLLALSGGSRVELRVADGLVVSPTTVTEVARLIADENAAWSFRATAGAPEGDASRTIESLLLAAVFELAA